MFRLLFGKNGKKNKTGRPLIIAHRGARKLAPENTLSAFKKADKMGFDGVEFDVVLTKDKVPVIFHGNDLSYTTRSSGLISNTPSHEIANIDAGEVFSVKFQKERIPTLSDTLDYLAKTKLFINIELKNQPRKHTGIEIITGQLIKHYDIKDRVIVSSFSPLMLRRFAKKYPDIPTSLLIGPHPFFFLKTLLSANMLRVQAINPVFQYTSEALVHFAHKQNWLVYVWNVNTKQEFTRAVEFGVDGIITDEPELLKIKL